MLYFILKDVYNYILYDFGTLDYFFSLLTFHHMYSFLKASIFFSATII